MLGERVDTILVIVILLILNGNVIMKEDYKKKYLYFALFGLFILSLIVAFWRQNTAYSMDLLLIRIYAQPTVCDILFVYLCSAEYFIQNGFNLVFLGYSIAGLLPYGTASEHHFTVFLRNNLAHNLGGGLFVAEGMLAFGPVGVVLYSIILGYAVKYFYSKNTFLHSTIFILIFIQMCRIAWYGIIFICKPLVLTIISVIGIQRLYKIKKSL